MDNAQIVQKLWNYCNGPRLGQSLARSPAREHAGTREKPRLTLRDAGPCFQPTPKQVRRDVHILKGVR